MHCEGSLKTHAGHEPSGLMDMTRKMNFSTLYLADVEGLVFQVFGVQFQESGGVTLSLQRPDESHIKARLGYPHTHNVRRTGQENCIVCCCRLSHAQAATAKLVDSTFRYC